MESLAATLVLINFIAAFITLGGLVVMMSFGAIFSRRQLVTSWPHEQEHSFAVYEHQNASSSAKAWMASLASAVALFILVVGIYAGVEPEHKDLGKDMNMSNLTKKQSAKTPAPTPAPVQQAPAPTPPAAPAGSAQ
jgi:hypothetical protein